ncbi:hypothetical protein [Streptomyces erythrochromogenes]|uniref:hypothetical protein n=1 Tax=Streptomyces erythrochromogenes TaxID=285574 RepID=UPI0036A4302A
MDVRPRVPAAAEDPPDVAAPEAVVRGCARSVPRDGAAVPAADADADVGSGAVAGGGDVPALPRVTARETTGPGVPVGAPRFSADVDPDPDPDPDAGRFGAVVPGRVRRWIWEVSRAGGPA